MIKLLNNKIRSIESVWGFHHFRRAVPKTQLHCLMFGENKMNYVIWSNIQRSCTENVGSNEWKCNILVNCQQMDSTVIISFGHYLLCLKCFFVSSSSLSLGLLLHFSCLTCEINSIVSKRPCTYHCINLVVNTGSLSFLSLG